MKNCITADLNSRLSRVFIPLGKIQISPLTTIVFILYFNHGTIPGAEGESTVITAYPTKCQSLDGAITEYVGRAIGPLNEHYIIDPYFAGPYGDIFRSLAK